MTTIKVDHFITVADADNIDTYLQQYRDAGFLVAEQTVKHEPGLRNGFVRFGPEYLEFIWVEDEGLFEAGADNATFPQMRELRAGKRPFAIGLESDDIPALHDELAARGYAWPEVTQGRARGAAPDSPPAWSFQTVPPDAVPGVFLFALTYHSRQKDAPRKVQVAPNTTYAISGITFATDEAQARATAWRDMFTPIEEIAGGEDGIYSLTISPHTLTWMPPEEYQDQYGLSYKASPHPFGEIAVIHLLAHDLDKAEETIGAARQITRLPDKLTGVDTLFVPPDERDGFTLAITQCSVEEWLRERVGVTGEKLELE